MFLHSPLRLCLLAVPLLWYVDCFAQKQNNQWRFGYAGGVSFNSAPPVGVSGSLIRTGEGSASVADRLTGKLLFYTNGVTVYNAQDNIMLNGKGLLGGDSMMLSSTTAAVIMPKPGSSSLFYLVTIDEQNSGNGMRYSLVDMTLDGGLGGIVSGEKNSLLLQTNSEKLEVVPAANGKDLWLITHDNPGNTFYSFLLTSAGFMKTPVTSSVGGTQGNGAGHLKVNRQFNRLAMGSLFDRTMEVFKFDNATGVVSASVTWKLDLNLSLIYGVEFSPNGKLLYVSDLARVVQFDISVANPSLIEQSALTLINSIAQPASLQLGPDGRIYITAGTLDVINCPDKPGLACGYQNVAVSNLSGGGGYGLPKWVYYPGDGPLSAGKPAILVSDSCFGNEMNFGLSANSGFTGITWNFGDPQSGAANSATGASAKHKFSQPGFFNIRAIFTTPCGTDTSFLVNREIVDCKNVCKGSIEVTPDYCLATAQQFKVKSANKVLGAQWNFGDPASGLNNTSLSLSAAHVFSDTGTFKVQCIVNLDCGSDTLFIIVRIVACPEPPAFCNLNIPNVFTPNFDSLNDVFTVTGDCSFGNYELLVFNRWGELLFRSLNPAEAWKGTYRGNDCPEGVYFYLLNYNFLQKPRNSSSGTITLIR